MKPAITDLDNREVYNLLVELEHNNIIEFSRLYLSKDTVVTIFYKFFLAAALLSAIVDTAASHYSYGAFIVSLVFSLLVSLTIFIPIHELLHGIMYKIIGARDIRYHKSSDNLAFYAVANNYVVAKIEFIMVAVMPFISISMFFAAVGVFNSSFRLFCILVIFFHSTMTSGDCALVNYIWINRNKVLYTYDDDTIGKTYFYEKI